MVAFRLFFVFNRVVVLPSACFVIAVLVTAAARAEVVGQAAPDINMLHDLL